MTGVDFLNVAVAGEVITPPRTTPNATTTAETMPYTGFNLIPWLLAAGLLALAGLLTPHGNGVEPALTTNR